jgi:hypothetical protein
MPLLLYCLTHALYKWEMLIFLMIDYIHRLFPLCKSVLQAHLLCWFYYYLFSMYKGSISLFRLLRNVRGAEVHCMQLLTALGIVSAEASCVQCWVFGCFCTSRPQAGLRHLELARCKHRFTVLSFQIQFFHSN